MRGARNHVVPSHTFPLLVPKLTLAFCWVFLLFLLINMLEISTEQEPEEERIVISQGFAEKEGKLQRLQKRWIRAIFQK